MNRLASALIYIAAVVWAVLWLITWATDGPPDDGRYASMMAAIYLVSAIIVWKLDQLGRVR